MCDLETHFDLPPATCCTALGFSRYTDHGRRLFSDAPCPVPVKNREIVINSLFSMGTGQALGIGMKQEQVYELIATGACVWSIYSNH
jgi:hypothetical protein